MWIKIRNTDNEKLAGARTELHRAIQIVSSFPRWFLEKSENDEKANLHWDRKNQVMKTQYFGGMNNIQLALNLKKYQIEVVIEDMLFEAISLEGKTINQIIDSIQSTLTGVQLDVSSYALKLPYNLEGQEFSTKHKFIPIESNTLKEISAFYQDAKIALNKTIEKEFNSKHSIRIWPHHFDIAFSFTPKPGAIVKVGMSPGDSYYNEPYFYSSIWPAQKDIISKSNKPIVGNWHTNTWTGVVLLSNDFILENEYLEERIILDFIKNSMQIVIKAAD